MSRRKPCLSWGAVLLSLLLGAGAWAGPPRLGAFVVASELELEGRALALARALEALGRRSSRYSFVDLQERAQAAEQRERAKRGEWGRKAQAEALQAFDELELERARRRIDEAVSLLEQSELEYGISPLLEALAYRALVLQVTEPTPDGATALLERIFGIDPTYEFRPARINPKFAELTEWARERVSAQQRTGLTVEAEGARGLVYVDGTLRGVTPCDVKGLLPGPHYVTVIAPGFLPAQLEGRAGPGERLTVKLVPAAGGEELVSRRRRLAEAFARGELREVSLELAQWAEVEELLLINLARRNGRLEVTTARMSGEGEPRLSTQTFEADTNTSEARALAKSLLEPGLGEKTNSDPIQSPTPAGVSFDSRTFAYVALGTSAASAVGGVLLGLATVGQVERAERVPLLDEAGYQRAYSQARWTAVGANVLYTVSLASAGAAAWLLLADAPWARAPMAAAAPGPSTHVLVTPLPGGAVFSLSRSFE